MTWPVGCCTLVRRRVALVSLLPPPPTSSTQSKKDQERNRPDIPREQLPPTNPSYPPPLPLHLPNPRGEPLPLLLSSFPPAAFARRLSSPFRLSHCSPFANCFPFHCPNGCSFHVSRIPPAPGFPRARGFSFLRRRRDRTGDRQSNPGSYSRIPGHVPILPD